MRKGPGSVYFVTQIFHSGQPSHGGDRKTFNFNKRNPYDKIDGIGILCRSVNVMNIFNSSPGRKRSHSHRHYTPLYLWFLSGFPWYTVATSNEATELRVPFVKVESFTVATMICPVGRNGEHWMQRKLILLQYRRRTDNTMDKRKSTKRQTTIYKTYT
jgi:hypothetical protein